MLTSPAPLAACRPVTEAAPSFEALYRAHVGEVGRVLRYLGVASADLPDVCQEVFVVAHRKLGDLEGEGGARAWLRKIAVFVAQNHRRTRRRQREDGGDDLGEQPTPGAPASERLEQRQRLQRLLATLTDDQRAVFVLYEIERMTMPEVARALSIPVQTAYSRHHAARQRVVDAVRAEEGER